jgi:hypothetical protein
MIVLFPRLRLPRLWLCCLFYLVLPTKRRARKLQRLAAVKSQWYLFRHYIPVVDEGNEDN